MNQFHWTLLLFWILYYALHSVLASSVVKDFFKKSLGKYFRYYRLSYSIFATVTLAFLLVYQYSFQSPLLFDLGPFTYLSFILMVIPGLFIMFISIKKYFLLLSGIRSVYMATPPSELKVEGIHRFVRHPLYSGTILFVVGLFFIFPTLSNLIAVIIMIAYILAGIIFEEKKLRKEFGKSYEEYMLKVPMLFPGFTFKKAKRTVV